MRHSSAAAACEDGFLCAVRLQKTMLPYGALRLFSEPSRLIVPICKLLPDCTVGAF
ncbi:MAG: hypothetical protein II341_03705 [Oscillospiraceae bacterium]|nr:hypothetical protein [Oscillospiraceae bacterium]